MKASAPDAAGPAVMSSPGRPASADTDPLPDGLEVDTIERLFADSRALTYLAESLQRRRRDRGVQHHPSFAVIPRLFAEKPPDTEINTSIRNMARDVHYRRQSKRMVANPDRVLKTLWGTLQERSRVDNGSTDTLWLNYHQFLECKRDIAAASPQVADMLTPKTFMRLHRNDHGEVPTHSLIDVIVRQVTLLQVRLDLCSYDFVGNGELIEVEIQSYIRDRIEVLPLLKSLVLQFYETYSVFAARKFCFFLDRHRTGRVRIKDLLLSDVLIEYNKMQYDELPPEAEANNWFSVPFVSKVHGDWVELDADESGLLNEAELMRFGSGGLTEPFVKRVFQYCQTYMGKHGREIDYKVYLDLVLAKMYPTRPESVRFLAHLIDVHDRGVISRQDVAHLWQGVIEHPLMEYQEPPSTDNIVNEVFDMVNPNNHEYITVSELVRSGVGHTVCGILTDVEAFFAYDNREMQDGGP
eukprot:m.188226 g.188226  ORF g.188226 m.188226 type:complete len:468 (-) comp17337_c0_seq1:497-1900(-)